MCSRGTTIDSHPHHPHRSIVVVVEQLVAIVVVSHLVLSKKIEIRLWEVVPTRHQRLVVVTDGWWFVGLLLLWIGGCIYGYSFLDLINRVYCCVDVVLSALLLFLIDWNDGYILNK